MNAFRFFKVVEISESVIELDNGWRATRNPTEGDAATIEAEAEMIFLLAKGLFAPKKKNFELALNWKTWAYQNTADYFRNAGDEDYLYNLS